MRSFLIVAVLAALIIPGSACAQQAETPPAPPKPCSAPEARQFDFWVGDWDLTWEGGRGTNRIESKWGGCVVQENFDASGPEGNGLIGMSVSTYNPRQGRWSQTWVDNQGSYLDFQGGLEEDRMILSREATGPNGQLIPQRMVWYNITAGSFDWNWERSDDGGETWTPLWVIHYERRAE